MNNSLIVLDRDGVLNQLLMDIEGNIDSPMSIEQVKIFPWVPSRLRRLCDMGFSLVVATNQPAWAKGKVSFETLTQVHNFIIEQVQSEGAKILSSYICFHRQEDNCQCRKPKMGLLKQAFSNSNFDKSTSWMVGDRATDIIAGSSFGLQTALLETPIFNDVDLLGDLKPSYKGLDLRDFTAFIGTRY